jgi:hypothetical protein
MRFGSPQQGVDESSKSFIIRATRNKSSSVKAIIPP